VDVGGTFSDAIVLDDQGRLGMGKSSTTPRDLAVGILGAVDAAAQDMGVLPSEVIEGCRLFCNGTTVCTNAMIQGKGGVAGLITTRGFEDTLVIGRVKALTVGLDESQLMDFHHLDKPPPVVPFPLTRGVTERIDFRGRVLCPLDGEDVGQALDELAARGIDSLAVCLLWSCSNPQHEQAIGDLARRKYPGVFVTLSSDVAPVMGEYERANTAAVNAFLGPVLGRYISNLTAMAEARRSRGQLLLMQSTGGLSPAAELRSMPVTTLLSGPAAGVVAAQRLGELLGEKNVVTTDMGGTSFDVGLIVDGVPQTARSLVVQRQLVLVPGVDVVTIGAGGGSVAWLDSARVLRVGPHSQGAMPGPACYGQGGELPTVTDANVVLGYINPAYFLGGKMAIHPDRAHAVIKSKIADPLGVPVTEAAYAIYEIVNAHMSDLIRRVTVQRGFDPHDFALLAFGGCGPTHCAGYSADTGVRKVVVPYGASLLCALGLAQSELKHSYARGCLATLPREAEADPRELARLNGLLAEMADRARRQMEEDGVPQGQWHLSASADMRYEGQINELRVPLTTLSLDPAALRLLCGEFEERYEKRYGAGSRSRQAPFELVNVRADVLAPTPFGYRPTYHDPVPGQHPPPPVARRQVHWGPASGWRDTPIYRGTQLAPGMEVEGPLVVELETTTVPVPPGHKLAMDGWRNLVVGTV